MIAIAVIKRINVNGEVIFNKDAENPRRITAIRFIWIPGIRPVIVPAKIPRLIARIR